MVDPSSGTTILIVDIYPFIWDNMFLNQKEKKNPQMESQTIYTQHYLDLQAQSGNQDVDQEPEIAAEGVVPWYQVHAEYGIDYV